MKNLKSIIKPHPNFRITSEMHIHYMKIESYVMFETCSVLSVHLTLFVLQSPQFSYQIKFKNSFLAPTKLRQGFLQYFFG